MKYTLIIFTLIFLVSLNQSCIRVYNEDILIKSNKISYLDYGDNLDQISLQGFLVTNWNETRYQINGSVFTLF